jgi:WD40 repeat protein
LEGHEKYVRDLAFTPDSAVLASSGADDLTLRMWDLATDPPEALDVLKHEKPVASVAFSSDGRLMASGSYGDSLIRIWRTDEQHPKELGSFRAPRPNVRQVRFTPDGTKLIALVKNRDDDEIIFATLQGAVQKSWKFPHHLGGFVLTADGEHLITLNEDSVYIAKLANP